MAASVDFWMLNLKFQICNRAAFSCTKQIYRSCHVSVEKPVSFFVKSTRMQFSISPTTNVKSSQPLRSRLLSDPILSAVTNRFLGISRPYSALPQRAIYTTPLWQHENTVSNRTCWNCGRKTDALQELFFCHCGVVQRPADDEANFYTLLGIDELFDIDLKKLGEIYKDLQKRLHPDKFSQKSETEQSLAEQQSSLLNKAYFTLLKPLPRALYILQLHGLTIEEDSTDLNPEFLMEVLELNERIGEGTSDDIAEVEADISSKIEENVKLLSKAFAVKDYQKAKEISVKLKYYVNVESKVKTFHRDRM